MTDNNHYKVDTHVHILPEYRLSPLLKWMKRSFPGHEVSAKCKPVDLVRDLYVGGVTHFFNLVYPINVEEAEPLNDFNIKFCRNIPGAIPFASVHQGTEDKVKVAEKALETNECAGFKLHPFVQKFDPWDLRMDPFYAFLQEVSKPVIFHTGFEDFYKKRMPLSKLKDLLKKFPNLPVVFVHMAFPALEELFDLMDEFPELYLDATGVFVFLRDDFSHFLPPHLSNGKLLHILLKGLEKYKNRILFGSDHPVGWGSIETIFKDLSFLPVSDDIIRSIKYGSAMTFIDRFLPGFDWSQNLQNYNEIK